MTFAKGLNWISLAIAVGAIAAWFMEFPVWWGAGLGVVGLLWFYFKKDSDSESAVDVTDVLDVFDGD